MTLAEDLVDQEVEAHCGRDTDPEDWDTQGLSRSVGELAGLPAEQLDELELDDKSPDEMLDTLWAAVKSRYEEKEEAIEAELLRRVERDVMLQIVDTQWKDHLYSLDHLKEGIGLRAHAQKDPLVEYKRESFALFQSMKERIDTEMIPLPVAAAAHRAGRRVGEPPPRRPAAGAADPQRSRRRRPGVRRRAGGRPRPAAGADRRRRRRGAHRAPGHPEGRTERSVSVRQRKEVQEMSWGLT